MATNLAIRTSNDGALGFWSFLLPAFPWFNGFAPEILVFSEELLYGEDYTLNHRKRKDSQLWPNEKKKKNSTLTFSLVSNKMTTNFLRTTFKSSSFELIVASLDIFLVTNFPFINGRWMKVQGVNKSIPSQFLGYFPLLG